MSAATIKRPTLVASAKAAKPSAAIAKLKAVQEWANTRVVGRADVVEAIILAVTAGANPLFLGPPGTAKTRTVQLVAKSFAAKDGDVFDILLTKFTKPFEFFGPVSTKALTEQDDLRYNTEGFAPGARVVIVDEVFKGSSAIMNAMLRLANERTFQNGRTVEETAVRTMVGMSNEFPEEPALLAAFFDRFAIKLMVTNLDASDFGEMLKLVASGANAPCPVTITDADFAEVDRLVDECELTDDVVEVVSQIREVLKSKAVVASDRRYAQAVRVMKAHAVLAGRKAVTRTDLCVLSLILWNTQQDVAVIRGILPEFTYPFERELRKITDAAYEERGKVIKALNADGADKNRPSPDYAQVVEVCGKAISRVKNLGSQLETIEQVHDAYEIDQDLMAAARESIREVGEALKSVLTSNPGGIAKLIASEKMDI